MFIKHFREVTYRVPDPMRPGHTAFDRRMDSAGTHALSHGGKEYHADEAGWFDIPEDVAKHFLSFPGWCSPEMVDEEIVAGRIRPDASDVLPNTRAEIEGAKSGGSVATAGAKRGKAKAASTDV
jgi:hypothetical protein